MFTAILAIASVLIVVGGVAYFIANYWGQITAVWDWVQTACTALGQLVAPWLLPVLGVILLVTVVGVILKII